MCSLPQICASDSYPHLDLALSSIDVMQAQTWDKTITKCWDEALDSGQLGDALWGFQPAVRRAQESESSCGPKATDVP